MTGLATTFALIVDGLCRAVAARAAKNRAAAPILVLLWSRLRRMVKRFDSLVARIRAGHLPGPRPAPGPRPPRPHKPDPLPRGEAWVIHAVPESTVFASQLRHFLGNPEMAALLAADKRVGRILRPLCRMLAIESGPDTVPPSPGRPPVPPTADPPAARSAPEALPSPGGTDSSRLFSSEAGRSRLRTVYLFRYKNIMATRKSLPS